MAEDNTMETHITATTDLVQRLADFNNKPSDIQIIAVLLTSLPTSYTPFIISLELNPLASDLNYVKARLLGEEACQTAEREGKEAEEKIVAELLAAEAANRPTTGRGITALARGVTQCGKKDVTCYACGKKGHYRGDPECEKQKETLVASFAVLGGEAFGVLPL